MYEKIIYFQICRGWVNKKYYFDRVSELLHVEIEFFFRLLKYLKELMTQKNRLIQSSQLHVYRSLWTWKEVWRQNPNPDSNGLSFKISDILVQEVLS